MSGEITTIRLPERDLTMIDYFVHSGEFRSKSDLIRYAVKKTICELMLKELQEKVGESKRKPSKRDAGRVLREIREIRKELWKEYAKHIP